jgi:hypothetical protein
MLQMCYNQNATLIQGNPLRLGCEKNYVSKKDCLFSRGFFCFLGGVGWRSEAEYSRRGASGGGGG